MKINQVLAVVTLALFAIVSASPVTKAQSLDEKVPVVTSVPDLYQLISQYFPEFKVSPSKHLKINQFKI